jgi:hypothetical protein
MVHHGYFQSLTISNNAAINMDVRVSLCFLGAHFFGYMPENSTTGSYGSSIFCSLKNSTLLSILIAQTYIMTNSVEVFLFLHIFSPTFVVVCVIDDSHFELELVELENIMLSKVNQAQKVKGHMFFPHIWMLDL